MAGPLKKQKMLRNHWDNGTPLIYTALAKPQFM